jgi:hypothetical protein
MLFSNTIFDNEKVVNQTEVFQYITILTALSIDVDKTVDAWEQMLRIFNG